MNIFTRALNDSKGTILCIGLALFSVSAAQAQATVTWTGAQNNIYANPNNWSSGAVPAANDNVIIPAGPANQPTVFALGRGLNVTIDPGAVLTLGPSGELKVSGNLVDNGSFGGDGILSMEGTAPQTISGSGTGTTGAAINVGDFNIGTLPSMTGVVVTLNHALNVARKMELFGILNTNPVSSTNTLTLLSTPSVTAFVINRGNSTTGPGAVNGPVTVQRAIDGFFNAGLGYRHYSSPVANSNVADLTTAGFTPEVSAGAAYNSSTTPRATVPFPTVYEYDQARVADATISYNPKIDRGYKVPAPGTGPGLGLLAPLEVTHGYAVNIASTALVDFVGTLNNGDYVRSLPRYAAGDDIPDGGWHLLGNPYPAPLDFSVIAPPPGTSQPDLIGIDAAMYVVRSSSQYGSTYRAYMSSANAVNPVIPVGQGFYVHVTTPGTNGTIMFHNSQRLTTSDNTPFQRPTPITHPQVELSLHSSANPMIDDLAIFYFENGSTAGVDPRYDALKLANSTGLNLSSLAPGGEALAIDARPVPTGQLALPLQVFVPANGTYTLHADELRNMTGLYTYLHDMQTGAYVDLAQTPTYTFNLVATNTTPRFELIVSAARVLTTASAAIAQQVSLYPSPTKEVAFVELPATLGGQAVQATLADALGRTVRTVELPAQGTAAHKVSVSGLTAGVYSLRLSTAAGMVVKRLVIE